MTKEEKRVETTEEYNARISKRINALKDAHEKAERDELINTLNVRDRLMRRTYKQPVLVKFKDDLGEFTIKCRQFAWKEHRNIGTLQKKLSELKNDIMGKEYKEAEREFFKFIAYPDGICLDPELDIEFWESGEFGIDVATEIFRQLTLAAQADRQAAQSFR